MERDNTMGFDRVDWPRLRDRVTILTVSRYMKHLIWGYGVDPVVVPNGIPRHLLDSVDETSVEVVRQGLGEGPLLVKVARWDPDKRWRLAVETVAHLKASGQPARLVARGVEVALSSIIPYGGNACSRLPPGTQPPGCRCSRACQAAAHLVELGSHDTTPDARLVALWWRRWPRREHRHADPCGVRSSSM